MLREFDIGGKVRLEINESPYVTVDTEIELDEALRVGRWPRLRGERTAGVIACKSPKLLRDQVRLQGPGTLMFDGPLSATGPTKLIEFQGNDQRLEDLKIRSLRPLNGPGMVYALAWPDWESHGNRVRLKHVEIFQVSRAFSKDGGPGDIPGPSSKPIVGVRIEDCLFRSFDGYGMHANFGFEDMWVERLKVFGRMPGETHKSPGNAIVCGINSKNNTFIDCEVGDVDRMGLESTVAGRTADGRYLTTNIGTRLIRCKSRRTGSFAFSIGHGKGSYVESLEAEDFAGIGLELASQRDDPSWGTFAGTCRIRRGNGGGWVTGISIDRMINTRVLNVEVEDIASSQPGMATGVNVIESLNCSVVIGKFRDCGQYQVQFHQGNQGTQAYGTHLAFGNEFRRTFAVSGGRAIRNFNTTLFAKGNMAWVKPGMTNDFESVCRLPGGTYCGELQPTLAGLFKGANDLMPEP